MYFVVRSADLRCSSNLESFEDGLVGQNTCGLSADAVNFTCRVSFNGNVAPVTTCKLDELLVSGVSTSASNNEVTSVAIVSASDIPNGAQLSCEIADLAVSTDSLANADILQPFSSPTLRWTSERIRVFKGLHCASF